MIKHVLFNGEIEIGISEIEDGNMRFFDGENESQIIVNQARLSQLISLNVDRTTRLRTIYDGRKNFTEYKEITEENLSDFSIGKAEKQIPISDGLVTKCPDIGILLPLADCLGIVNFDSQNKIVGLLHSGRQNIEQHGPKKFIEYFVKNFGSDPRKLKLYFSPYALEYRICKLDNKGLAEAAIEQLISAEILPGNIIDTKLDTVSNANFPSYSSGDTHKRFAIVVKRKG